MTISSNQNTIFVQGELTQENNFRLMAAMHNTVEKKGYSDFSLDFSRCTKAFASEMLAISMQCQAYWKTGIDISLVLPLDGKMNRLFLNTNWAHLIDNRSFEPSRFRGYTHAPALRFSDGIEQKQVVDKMLDILLAAISHFSRDEIRYIEWALNEITDNVINHAESSVGGVVQVTNHRQREQIEFTVCDSGVGIPATLKASHPEIRTDTEALDAAIKEGITRDKSIGQGNGLYGTWRISQRSGGKFQILSACGHLVSSERKGLRIREGVIPIKGTLVVARIGYSDRFDLSDALMFSGRRHIPTDYIETHFDEDEKGNIQFILRKESNGFGSRAAGEPVRRKLINVIGCLSVGCARIDFEDVHLVSSSYADEVFGKLFVELGPVQFMKKVEFENLDPLVGDLIDRAMTQRIQQ